MVTANSVGNTQIIARIRSGNTYVYDTCQVRVVSNETILYNIRFLNYDSVELYTTQVVEGEVPVYTGATPIHPEDEDFTYEFIGWLPEVVAAVANADYVAQFEAVAKPSTGLEDIPAADALRKILINGTIYILRGEKVYTLTGQEVK
jgi:hypothetical protein